MLNVNRMNSNSFISFNKKLKNKKKNFLKNTLVLRPRHLAINN